MAGNIKGITVEIGGNTGPLDKALQGVNKTSRDLQNELRQVEKLLKLDPTNTELLAQKQKILADSVENTKEKLSKLKEAEKQAQQQFKEGKISEEQYRALEREIVSSEQNLKSLEKQGKKTNDTLSGKKPLESLKNIAKAAAAAATAAGAAFVGMASAALENADELQRQADVTGLSAERLQELQYVGKNLGVELDTITGAQTKLTKAMSAAKDGTGAQADAFKALGINVVDSNGQLRDAKDIMSEAFTALNGVGNETERDSLAMQIFGKSAMELNPIIKAGGDELSRLTKEARENGAVMSDKAVAGLDTFGDTLDNIKTSIMGAFGESLAALIPKIQELINKVDLEKIKDGIKAFAERVVDLLSFVLENGNTIISIIAGIGAGFIAWNVATMIQGVVGAVKAFQAANEGATIAQWALNAAQNANPIGIIVMLIAGLVTAIITLWNTNEDFRNALTGIWEGIKTAVKTALDAVVNAFNSVIDFIKNNWQALLLMIVNPFAGAFKLLYDNCSGFRNFVDKFVADVKKAFTDVWNSIVKFFTEKIPNFIDEVIGWFKKLPGSMLDIGKNIVSGIWDGIKNMSSWLWDKVKGFADGIVDGIKGALKINSPSQVLADEVGKYMAQGVGVGFEDEMSSVSMNMAKAIPVKRNDYVPGSTDAVNTNANSGSAEAIISIPVSLDGKVITNVVSKVQYSNGRIRARGIGVVTP